jgi:dihydroorotase
MDMPNTDPAPFNARNLLLKCQRASERSHVDFGIYGLLDESSMPHLVDLVEAGAIAFKCFMSDTTGDLPFPSDGAMLEAFEILAPLGIRTTVHAENASIIEYRTKRLREAGRTDPHAHLAARPDVAAIEATGRAITFAEWTGARLHIAHESCSGSLRLIRDAKARGVDVTAETCPHYLFFDERDLERQGGQLRINPPIRRRDTPSALWSGLVDGTIDMIATDHAPHTLEEKSQDDIWDVARGIFGVQTQLQVMLGAVHDKKLTLSQYVRLACEAPARAFGIFPRKGSIRPGADADLVVVDLDEREPVDQKAMRSRHRFSPWHGHPTGGAVKCVLLRGQVIVQDGILIGHPGDGGQVEVHHEAPHPINTDRYLARECALSNA